MVTPENEKWKKASEWELEWHSNCINSLYEEEKQIVYAEKMGLVRTPTPKTPYNFDLQGKSILDIGGGAYSLLLKCVNHKNCVIIDPLLAKHPSWVLMRYEEADIQAESITGEDVGVSYFQESLFDEVWIYNLLEHVIDPKKVIENALELGKVVRIFEWVETRLGVNDGHIHSLKESELNECLGGEGRVEQIKRGGATGKCYYGVFKGNHYE